MLNLKFVSQSRSLEVKDNDTGGRPTPIDSPIMLKSIKNNVGFLVNGKKTLNLALVEQINAPF